LAESSSRSGKEFAEFSEVGIALRNRQRNTPRANSSATARRRSSGDGGGKESDSEIASPFGTSHQVTQPDPTPWPGNLCRSRAPPPTKPNHPNPSLVRLPTTEPHGTRNPWRIQINFEVTAPRESPQGHFTCFFEHRPTPTTFRTWFKIFWPPGKSEGRRWCFALSPAFFRVLCPLLLGKTHSGRLSGVSAGGQTETLCFHDPPQPLLSLGPNSRHSLSLWPSA